MNEEKETGRIEAFSDGMFAVAITLLVLDIKVPPVQLNNPDFSLAHELLAQWPAYIAFATSFLTILVMWINHHRIFGLVRRSDDRFLLLNGLLLMCVTLIPFSTSLIAAYVLHRDAKLAVQVYAGLNFCMALAFNQLWRYAAHSGRLLARDHDPRVAEGITRSYRYGPTIYLTVFLLAFFSPATSVAICLILAVYFAIPPHKHASTPHQ